MSHNFDEAIAVELSGPDAFTSQTHPAYANMVGPFGGVTAGAVVRALHQHERSLGEPAALTINYVAPIADGAWRLVVEEVRTNRSNQHWLFRIIQDEQVVTTGSMVFAAVRDTWGATELAPPPVGPPEEVPAAEPIIPLAWLSRSSTSRASFKKERPASDRMIPRGCRSTRMMPSSSSSNLICRESDGWLTFSFPAAR